MRYGILGDVHGNLEALEVAIAGLASRQVDRYVQMGDLVGYGADPAPCIARIRELGASVVAGNHDWAVIGKLDTSFFNVYAREAVEWTRSHLSREELHYLETLPLVDELDNEVTLVHATLDQPEVFDYIQTYYDAHRSLKALDTRVCFMGHSHVPMAFLQSRSIVHTNREELSLADVDRALVNVGSVGQPRDENPKTAYAIYDSGSHNYTLYRDAYDTETTGDKIRKAGLPAILGERLLYGR
ncbi:MAG: metallophosphoesterase family protein [Planctomycetes bacterium]|nr:metallophosphoesterase family protein [Planctomycetota bacterium]